MSETVTMTLSEFLLARIAEDEASLPSGFDCWYEPERYAAECEAKRLIVTIWRGVGSDSMHARATLLALALPYADHPDYDEEWAQ